MFSKVEKILHAVILPIDASIIFLDIHGSNTGWFCFTLLQSNMSLRMQLPTFFFF